MFCSELKPGDQFRVTEDMSTLTIYTLLSASEWVFKIDWADLDNLSDYYLWNPSQNVSVELVH